MTIEQPHPQTPPPHPQGESYCFNMNKELLNLSSGCQRSSLRDYFLGTAGDIHWPGLKIYCRKTPVKVDWVTVMTDSIESRQKKVRNVEKGSSEALFIHFSEHQHFFLPVTQWKSCRSRRRTKGGNFSEGLQRMLKCR